MKLLLLSDTHGRHRKIHTLPPADVIIHAGDFTSHGTMKNCVDFLNWFNALNYEHKICVAGNHDLYMDVDYLNGGGSQSGIDAILPPTITYLNESEIVINGFKFWGSPYTPYFFGWAFNAERGHEIQEHWNKIPTDVDVVISHGPPYGYGDACPNFNDPSGPYIKVGCTNLRQTLEENIKPSLHVFGHVHAGYGISTNADTLFVNASICNEAYQAVNKSILVELNENGAHAIVYE
jgi:Icc-related predicted phosphoesterase